MESEDGSKSATGGRDARRIVQAQQRSAQTDDSVELDVSNNAPPVSGGYLAAMYEEEDLHKKRSTRPEPFDEETAFAGGQRVEISQDSAPMPLQYLEEGPVGGKKNRRANASRRSNAPAANQRAGESQVAVDGHSPQAHSTPRVQRSVEIPPPQQPGVMWQQINAPSPPPDESTVASSGAPTPLLLYSVEAVRVDPEREREPSPDPPRQTVYDATLIIPWWQQRKRLMISLVAALAVGASIAVGILFGRQTPGPSPLPTSRPTLPPLTTTPPTLPEDLIPISSTKPTQTLSPTTSSTAALEIFEGVSNGTYLRNFFETECSEPCQPILEASGDTVVVAPMLTTVNCKDLDEPSWEQAIHIFNKTATGNFETLQVLDIDYQPGSISIYGDTMIVGSNCEDLETGAAYFYERNSSGLWQQVQKIVPPDGRIDAEFGIRVDMHGDVAVVGAYQDRLGKIGSVYIYRKNDEKDNGVQWLLEKKLAPTGDSNIYNFGLAVAIRGNMIAVGDRSYGQNKTDTNNEGPKRKGAVWLYQYDSSSKDWEEFGSVMTNDDCDNFFGISLAFTFDYGLAVGCPGEDNNAGAVFFFLLSQSGYVFQQKILAFDRGRGDNMGNMDQISVYSNVMAVGTSNGVRVFIRTSNVWVEANAIDAPETTKKFGNRLALAKGNIVVASRHNAYFFELAEGPSPVPCKSFKAAEAIFSADCTRCDPSAAIDDNAMAVSKDKESLQITSGSTTAIFDSTHLFGGIAMSGNVVVCGAPEENEKSGFVRVFHSFSGNWYEFPKLSPNVAVSRERFGQAVGVDGLVIAVGAYDYLYHDASKRGSVYMFRHNESNPVLYDWVQEAVLQPNDPNMEGFGQVLSIIGNTVAVGDIRYNNSAGAVFVYEHESSSKTWQLRDTITSEDCDGMFGSSVVLTRDNGLMIGCSGDRTNTGAVYYYARAADYSYVLQQKITALDGESNDSFGDANQVAVDHDLMVVGTNRATDGSVRVFSKANGAWVEIGTIGRPGSSYFGYRVALSGRKLLVSSIQNVYPYTIEGC